MAIPELYRYGREGKWFGLKWFTVYMFDGVYQVRCLLPSLTYVANTSQVCRYIFPHSLRLLFSHFTS